MNQAEPQIMPPSSSPTDEPLATGAYAARAKDAQSVGTVLVTGASGYLGRSLCAMLSKNYDVLRLDTVDGEGAGEFVCGSITDRDILEPACARADILILAHMASTRTNAYEWPDICMDVNVKGVALALEAAARHDIKRVILISSVSVVWGHVQARTFLTSDLPPDPTDLYGMTKTLQEQIARYYHKVRGLEIAVLRPAYILCEDSLINKYGNSIDTVTWQCIDPRDIGQAVIEAIQSTDLGFETYYVIAGPNAERFADIDSTRRRLGWNPIHRFTGIEIEEI